MPRSTERARGPFYPFLDPIPPNEGGARKKEKSKTLQILHGSAHGEEEQTQVLWNFSFLGLSLNRR